MRILVASFSGRERISLTAELRSSIRYAMMLGKLSFPFFPRNERLVSSLLSDDSIVNILPKFTPLREIELHRRGNALLIGYMMDSSHT